MMENIIKWVYYFDDDRDNHVDLKIDALESNNVELLPGRFYILQYMSKSEKPFNTRPIILSLGMSKKDPESFLCIDLCILPKTIRLRFI